MDMEDTMDSLRAWLTRREGTIRLVLRDARAWVSRGRCRRGFLPRCGISTFTLPQVPPFPFVYVMLTRSFVIAGYAVSPLTSKQSRFFSFPSRQHCLFFFVLSKLKKIVKMGGNQNCMNILLEDIGNMVAIVWRQAQARRRRCNGHWWSIGNAFEQDHLCSGCKWRLSFSSLLSLCLSHSRSMMVYYRPASIMGFSRVFVTM